MTNLYFEELEMGTRSAAGSLHRWLSHRTIAAWQGSRLGRGGATAGF